MRNSRIILRNANYANFVIFEQRNASILGPIIVSENEKFAEMSKEDLREREEEEEGRLKECEEKKEQGMKRKKLEEEDRLRQEEAKLKKRSSAQ